MALRPSASPPKATKSPASFSMCKEPQAKWHRFTPPLRPKPHKLSEFMPRPIKILHCLGTLDPGGVETWLLRVLGSIDRDQFQFDFCTLGDRKGLYADEMEQLGAKVIRCPLAEYWSFGSRFNSLLKAGQYQVVHSHVH